VAYRFMLLHGCTDSNAIDMPHDFTRGARRRATLIVLNFGRAVSIPGQSNPAYMTSFMRLRNSHQLIG
jgi:hypothetical protein